MKVGRAALPVLIALVAPLFGCSEAAEPGPSTVPVVEPAALPTFVESAATAGFTTKQGKRVTEGACMYNAAKIFEKFPDLVQPKVNQIANQECEPEELTGGAGAIDLTGDGLDDVVMTRMYAPPILYVNESSPGKPSFRDATMGSGLENLDENTNGVGFADVDKDGDVDLIMTTTAGRQSYLLINDGSGKFVDEADERGIAGRDGRPHSGQGVALGDFDNDGWVDVHVNEWQLATVTRFGVPSHARLFRNLGSAGKPGYFEDVTESAGVSIDSRFDAVYSWSSTLTDFDGDGFPDLSIISDYNTSRFFWNNGDGTFTDGTPTMVPTKLGREENGMGLAVGFYGPQQRIGMFITSIMSSEGCDPYVRTGSRFYLYDADRRFTDETDAAGVRSGGWGWGATVLDPTNAAKRDLISATGIFIPREPCHHDDPIFYWVDDGTGVYGERAAAVGISNTLPSKGVLAFDADNDGRQDLLVTRDTETPLFFHNVTASVGSWLKVKVQGVDSNTDAYGAIVTAWTTLDASPQRFLVGGGSRLFTQDSPAVHAGFGAFAGPLAKLTVEFPTTKRTVTLTDVPLNSTVNVTEPAQ